MSTEEQILVIPAAVIRSLGLWEGFSTDVDRYLPAILTSPELSFQPRTAMESDPSFKQLIPYVILQHTDAGGETHVFAYTRGRGQGERRLHAQRSIGIGGHISREDAAGGSNPYHTGMRRELDEEVRIDAAYSERCVGMIYDPSTEVGRVHLGIVHRFELVEPRVEPNEDDIADAGFVPLSQLRDGLDSLEVWSRLCLEHLDAAEAAN